MKEKKIRPKYTKEFKEDAVKLVTTQGYSSPEVGRRLGIHASNVSRWVREYQRDQEEIGKFGKTHRDETDHDNLWTCAMTYNDFLLFNPLGAG